MIDPFKSVEHFIEVEKQMTEKKLESISSQMDRVHSALADMQTRFNDYYTSVQAEVEQQSSEMADHQQQAPASPDTSSQASPEAPVSPPAPDESGGEARPAEPPPGPDHGAPAEPAKQIHAADKEMKSLIKSINHSLAEIDKFIISEKFTAEFSEELKKAKGVLSDTLKSATAAPDTPADGEKTTYD